MRRFLWARRLQGAPEKPVIGSNTAVRDTNNIDYQPKLTITSLNNTISTNNELFIIDKNSRIRFLVCKMMFLFFHIFQRIKLHQLI